MRYERFADASFFIAFLNSGDKHHSQACEFMDSFAGGILTTSWILLEVGNYLAKHRNRRLFAQLIKEIRADARFDVLTLDEALFDSALEFYDARADQTWSLTDCSSFLIMQRFQLIEAFTADHHFEQAGFVALLK